MSIVLLFLIYIYESIVKTISTALKYSKFNNNIIDKTILKALLFYKEILIYINIEKVLIYIESRIEIF